MSPLFNLKVPMIALLLGQSTGAWALQTYAVRHQDQVDITLSATEMNRLSLQDDRIHQVFGLTDAYMLETDEQGGQIFLKALSPTAPPLTVTLISEKGRTYDVRVQLQAQGAQSILLKERGSPAPAWRSGGADQEMLAFLKDMVQERPYEGVLIQRPSSQEQRFVPSGGAKLLLTYEDEDFRGLVFDVHRPSSPAGTFRPEEFARPGDDAIAFQTDSPDVVSSFKAYVVQRKEK